MCCLCHSICKQLSVLVLLPRLLRLLCTGLRRERKRTHPLLAEKRGRSSRCCGLAFSLLMNLWRSSRSIFYKGRWHNKGRGRRRNIFWRWPHPVERQNDWTSSAKIWNGRISNNTEWRNIPTRGTRIKQQFWVKDFHSNLNNCRRKNNDKYDVSTARTTALHR